MAREYPDFPKPIVIRVAAYVLFALAGILLLTNGDTFEHFYGKDRAVLLSRWLWIPPALIALSVYLSTRKLAQRARAHDLRLCARCAHPFDSTAPVHTCARCGHVQNTLRARTIWRRVAMQIRSKGSPRIPRKARILPSLWHVAALALLGVVLYFAQDLVTEHLDWRPTHTTTTTTVTTATGETITREIPVRTPANPVHVVLFWVLTSLAMLTMPIMFVTLFWRQRVVAKRLERADEHDFLICEHCLYPLENAKHGANERSKCPECGHLYELEKLRRSWHAAFARFRPRDAFQRDVPILDESARKSALPVD